MFHVERNLNAPTASVPLKAERRLHALLQVSATARAPLSCLLRRGWHGPALLTAFINRTGWYQDTADNSDMLSVMSAMDRFPAPPDAS